jgi:hypothetical protein
METKTNQKWKQHTPRSAADLPPGAEMDKESLGKWKER